MPNISVTFGSKTYTHAISNGDATRMLTALSVQRNIPATADAVCPAVAKEFFQSLKSQTRFYESTLPVIADIPATES